MFAPNGLLLMNHEATATYWDVAEGAQTLSFNYQTTSVRPALHQEVFTRDGKVLISEGTLPDLGHLQFFDAANGQLLRTISAYGYAVGRLAISPNGELLATSGAERGSDSSGAEPGSQYLKLWNVATGELAHQFTEATDGITDIEFSPDGTLLLTSQRDGLVRLWSVADGTAVRDLATGWQHIEGAMSNYSGNSVAFSPDGTLAASAGVDWTVTESHTGSIAFWSVKDGTLKGRLLSLAEGNLGEIAWSPDAKLLAAGVNAGVRIWCLDELASAPTFMPQPSRIAQP
jgi:WD40 repeat protein